ncbi:MAG: ribonuclease III [Acidimicrobiaceae bacterium]|nr:ribonuclease III [Acidimicrobiaceae bacterium]
MERIGYRFDDGGLLELALTHRSWCAEHEGARSNERLEFLGDAVLGLSVAQRIYTQDHQCSEGDLTKTSAALVNAATLADVARSVGLGGQLRLSRGELATGGGDKPSLLADAVEAVIGAVFLDGGFEAAQAVVSRMLGPRIEDAARAPGHGDFKTRLQELAARLGSAPPVYDTTESGPAHCKLFEATVSAAAATGIGRGSTKKDAEQRAAEVAYKALVEQVRS